MSTVLSQLIWENDLSAITDLLEKRRRQDPSADFISSIDDWDLRGNPPLHLALMLGRKEAARILLEFGASPSSVNSHNYDAVDEAVCLGDRELLALIYQTYFREELDALISKNGPWDKVNMVYCFFLTLFLFY
jgi:hypothetical protein